MEILGLSASTPKPTSRIRELFWPDIQDEVAAVTAARNTIYACLLIAISTGVLALMSGQSAWISVDVLLFIMAGIGVRQLSRAAAITAFVMFALGWLAAGGFNILRPILLAVLLGGIRAATFAHHLKKEVRETMANPAMDTTTMSRLGILLEELPRRAWPVIHGPFLVVLGLLVALNLVVLNSLLFGQIFSIPTASMEPTVYYGDHVFMLRSLFTGEVRRGDVMVMRYPVDRRQIFLKRVVGMPGDRIKIVNKELRVNGARVSEPYVQHITNYVDSYRDNFLSEPNISLELEGIEMLASNVNAGEVVVPPGAYFVMGDNRDNSLDSRYWGFVSNSDLMGRPLLVLGKGKPQFLRYPLGR
jgi:signal peptidase I